MSFMEMLALALSESIEERCCEAVFTCEKCHQHFNHAKEEHEMRQHLCLSCSITRWL